MERKDKNQKRKIIIFWLVFVIVGLLLILGFALYYSNKIVVKHIFTTQTDIVLDSDSGKVGPSIVILDESSQDQPSQITWTIEPSESETEDNNQPYPVDAEVITTDEKEQEAKQKEEVEAEVLETDKQQYEIKAEVLEGTSVETGIKAEVLETNKQQYEIKAEVLEGISVETGVKAEVLETDKQQYEIKAEVLGNNRIKAEVISKDKEEIKAEFLKDIKQQYEIKAEVFGNNRIKAEVISKNKEEIKAEFLKDIKQQYEIKAEVLGNNQIIAEVLETVDQKKVVKAEVLEAPKSKGFAVKKIEFSESQIFEDKELDAIVKESKKDHAGMDLLNDVVDKVNEEYEEKGYPNAVAYIPEQTAKDGVFKIELVEGKLGSFTVVDNKYTFDAYYLWRFHFDRKKPLNLKDFEHQLILFNKWNDGYAATATINPGKTAGTSDITLNAKETYPFSIVGVYDNYGSEGTGKLRVGAHLVIQSLLKMRDTLQAGIIANTAFNAPYVDYSILTPSLRLRLGARYSVGNSEVVSGAAKDYKIKGSNVSQSAYFSVPIMEASALQFTLTGSANYLHSKSISMDEIILSEITVTSGQIGGTYVYSPENAYLVHTVNLTKAVPYFDANSSFTKIDGSFNFNFGLFKLATLILKAQYQLVIDSDVDFPRVMYMQAGGATTVRGYAEACNEGKDGFIGNAELRFPVLRSADFNIDLFGFADYAFVVPEPDHKENTMWSWGIGADVDLGAIHASAVYGWPQINLTQDPNATNGRLHIAIKLAPVFSNK